MWMSQPGSCDTTESKENRIHCILLDIHQAAWTCYLKSCSSAQRSLGNSRVDSAVWHCKKKTSPFLFTLHAPMNHLLNPKEPWNDATCENAYAYAPKTYVWCGTRSTNHDLPDQGQNHRPQRWQPWQPGNARSQMGAPGSQLPQRRRLWGGTSPWPATF